MNVYFKAILSPFIKNIRQSQNLFIICLCFQILLKTELEMWANAQRDGLPAEYR